MWADEAPKCPDPKPRMTGSRSLRDPEFRALCEDYALATASLAGFEARRDASERPEIAEYRTVLAELEAEILRCVLTARDGPDCEEPDR
jgi:hypothetical protein